MVCGLEDSVSEGKTNNSCHYALFCFQTYHLNATFFHETIQKTPYYPLFFLVRFSAQMSLKYMRLEEFLQTYGFSSVGNRT